MSEPVIAPSPTLPRAVRKGGSFKIPSLVQSTGEDKGWGDKWG